MIGFDFLHVPIGPGGRLPLSVALVLVLFSTIYFARQARAIQPVITKIEPFNTNQLLLHFDTEANYTYNLQYSDGVASNGVLVHAWSNLFTAPNYPFPNHYVILDYRTNRMRFYRLVATP